MSDDLASRLRDIAEEYLYLDAPLKELKSKLLHEAADKYDDTCVEIARMNIEISNLKVELIKTKAVRNLPEKTKLAEQLTEARALIEKISVALESIIGNAEIAGANCDTALAKLAMKEIAAWKKV